MHPLDTLDRLAETVDEGGLGLCNIMIPSTSALSTNATTRCCADCAVRS